MNVKILFSLVLLFCSCIVLSQTTDHAGSNVAPVTTIEFTTGTRGYQKHVFISADSLIEITEGRENKDQPVKKKMTEEEWANLINSMEGLSLTEIEKLPPPSSRSAFDAANQSSITISTSDGRSYKHTFDNEHPHEKLLSLMKAIQKIKSPE